MHKNNLKNLQSGQAMLLAIIFFLFVSMVIVLGIANPVLKQVKIAQDLISSKKSLYLAEGSLEDVIYRIKNNKQISATETLFNALDSVYLTSVNTPTGKQFIATAKVNGSVIRKMQADVVFGTGASFNYGVQAGRGGFILENSASITGNVYSNGTIVGSGNLIDGDAISADSTGLIDSVHTTGSAYAHIIQGSIVDKDAYYVSKTGTTVGGVSHPGSSDQATSTLPISDTQIASFEADALAGGIVSSPCPYQIISNQTLGPIKINCDLEISGSPTVTLLGTVWVVGNITFKNSPIIKVSSGLGNKSVVMVADNQSDRSGSGVINLNNSVQFLGSGSNSSFIFLISQNNSAETGGSNEAISLDNSSTGSIILYAGHGLVSINNSATLKEITGYAIKAKNSSNIIYSTGLANTLFTSGPGGGYQLLDWFETQ